ncbi:type II/III secretion system domain protein [Tatumella sp. JGM130]|uniref:type II/III secretion system domain protein n=1 Tax=Tatumella sp. JGM130 TaxID=2799797 RepID=UPI001BAE75FE|nr:type II/III secretion system domain protein [Tatumella sp. JGM130]MBS0895410.1 type II/III secretion system domain protein [Tatumella sp. JGM130]MBS0895422.1 type II/III secretion system domain protein [Tatumella sp. JGM130]
MEQETLKVFFVQFGTMKNDKTNEDFNWGNAQALSTEFESTNSSCGFAPAKVKITPDNRHAICLKMRDDLEIAFKAGKPFLEIIPSYGLKASKGIMVPVIVDYQIVGKSDLKS